ncbi:CPBP family glutamic-type intramembrane protease [Deinococcus planocerae]|uniref:CPBP family glutamic-type intramembrane protease n=1 Tax=Deinococcus planocerae TaxID=1737569 RepID=UPI0015E12BE3|nr:CPBP family glutamic-type intramembrane protease [Deinococcus planocerae]
MPWILGLVLLVVLLEVVVQSRWVVPWVIEQTGWTPKRGPSDELLDRIVWSPMIEEALFRLALIPGLVDFAAFLGNPGVRRPQEAWRLLPWFGVVSLVGCIGLNAFDVLKAALDQRQWSPTIVFITPLVLAWLSLGLRQRHPSGQLSPGWLIGCAAVTNTLFALGHLYNYPDLPHHPAVLGLAIPQLMSGAVFSWAAARYGLRAAMLCHGCDNAFVTVLGAVPLVWRVLTS